MATESNIHLVDPLSGRRYPSAPEQAVVLSSVVSGWRTGLTFEVQRLAPAALGEHLLEGHRLIVNLGGPVRFGWHVGDRPREALLPTGGLCLQSEGDTNAPFWRDELTVAAVAIAPDFASRILEERAPLPIETFAERRCLEEPQAHAYARALASELAKPGEPLYAETLSLAFTLHLLANHGRPGRGPLVPRGKLTAAQLRSVSELAHDRLADEVSLEQLAGAAHLSAFHFARLFKRTVGIAPHRYVLNLRLERAQRLLREAKLTPAQVAMEVGFYDQAHLSNVFRRELGVTPALFAART
ncbi:MAG: helix-turn-helix transcriptional regulator [Gemmatimonadaceae bacterium]|nr:helix-turn-helix transcriptional regulator [Gloeobacterales cyanobacterium ES-bin-141]